MSSAKIPPFMKVPPASFDIPGTNTRARLFQEGDAENLTRLATNEAVQRYVPWAKRIHDADSAAATIHEFQNVWDKKIMARYAIEKDQQFVGYVGLWSDQITGYYEFGFATLPELQGQGIGTSVITELLSITKQHLDAKGMVAYVGDTNDASKAVITKLGFQPTDQFDSGDRRYELQF